MNSLVAPSISEVGLQEPVKARDLEFRVSTGSAVRALISSGHYSGKCPPSTYYFGAYYNDVLLGGLAFRKPSLPKIANGYGVDLELSRLFIDDIAGRNSESRFIGWALRYLKKHTDTRAVISYADPFYGHVGTIYKAANFEYLGLEKGHGTRLLFVNGEMIQAKTAYDRWGASGKNLEAILGVPVEVKVMPKKHVWVRRIASPAKSNAQYTGIHHVNT